MNLIFICSYLNVTDVIDTIEHEGDDFTILTPIDEIYDLFSDLYSSNKVIKLPKLFDSLRPSFKLFKDLVLLHGYKKKFLNICNKLEPTKIIFYYIGFNGFESWLIKKMSKGSAVYHREKVDMSELRPYKSLKLATKTFLYSYIYGIKFSSGWFYGYQMIVIDDYFFKLINCKKYEHEFDPRNIVNFLRKRQNNKNKIDVMLLIGGHYDVEETEYISVMNDVYRILLNTYTASNIAIKNHPSFPPIKGDWCVDTLLYDDKLAANLLCYNSKVVIGYGSSVLSEASDIGKYVISTVCMISATKPGQEDDFVKYLTESSLSKKILFPRSMVDFQNLLILKKEGEF